MSKTQGDLNFGTDLETRANEIPGLLYVPDFIGEQMEKELLSKIDTSVWLGDLRRRVQHYGYKYDYKSRKIDRGMKIGELPVWSAGLLDLLVSRKYLPVKPDQLIINEYEPGQGIAAHVDCEPCFEDNIASLSLGGPVMMEFSSIETSEKIPIYLAPRSLFVLCGESRYKWKHGISPRKTDKPAGQIIKRTRRVSLTFRKVIV